jgi:hypothetical protein
MSCHGSGTVAVIDNSSCSGCPGSSDWAACINNTLVSLGSGGTLQFQRGQEYLIAAQLLIQVPGVTFEAIGSGARPILKFTTSINTGAVVVQADGVSLINLDLRGVYYNSQYREGGSYFGINACRPDDPGSPTDDLLISGTSVNGFGDHGLIINGYADGLAVQNSEFQYNGRSALALFADKLVNPDNPVNATIQGNLLAYNGEDGIDCSGSSISIVDNTIIHNGWANVPHGLAEGHGVLLNADAAQADVTSVLIQNNYINSNTRNGVFLHNPSQWKYDSIEIADNYLLSNGTDYATGHGYGIPISGSITGSAMTWLGTPAGATTFHRRVSSSAATVARARADQVLTAVTALNDC